MADGKKMGFGVGVMVLCNHKILLGKRHDDPGKASSALHGAGTWSMPGGKVDFGESLEQAAAREVWEETGVKIRPEKLKIISLTNDVVSDAHFLTVGWLCEDFLGEARVMEPDEITEWQWFDLDALPEPIFFPCVKILKNYSAQKIYFA